VARPRAADYGSKRDAILKAAARLFADRGFDRSSMAEVALACGVSKALVYHYYVNKDELLFDIINTHLVELVDLVEAARDPALPPSEQLLRLITVILEAYRDADAEHKVQIAHLTALSPEKQSELKHLERRLVAAFADVIVAVEPRLRQTPERIKPLTMTLFGILNWNFMWFRDEGQLSRTEYAHLVMRLFLSGTREI
jgi:TetR/AcrR family transcriptional regulator